MNANWILTKGTQTSFRWVCRLGRPIWTGFIEILISYRVSKTNSSFQNVTNIQTNVWLDGIESSGIFKIMKNNETFWSLDNDWTEWGTMRISKQWKDNEHSDHWIMTGWHGEQWDFQNNEKHSDHWIMTGRNGEQWEFQNNEKTMNILITG